MSSSTTLFNIFINDLLLKLRNSGVGLYINIERGVLYSLLFTDDVALCAESEGNLETILNILHSWCNEWNLQIYTSKTKVIHFRQINCKLSKHTSMIGEYRLETVPEYTYLGLIFNQFLTWSKPVENVAKKASKVAHYLLAK